MSKNLETVVCRRPIEAFSASLVVVGGLQTLSWHCQGLSVLYCRGADVLAMAGEAAKYFWQIPNSK
jgi:hypothetical protein